MNIVSPACHIHEVPSVWILHCLLVGDGHIMLAIVGHVLHVLLHVLTACTEGTDLTIVIRIREGVVCGFSRIGFCTRDEVIVDTTCLGSKVVVHATRSAVSLLSISQFLVLAEVLQRPVIAGAHCCHIICIVRIFCPTPQQEFVIRSCTLDFIGNDSVATIDLDLVDLTQLTTSQLEDHVSRFCCIIWITCCEEVITATIVITIVASITATDCPL